MRIITTDKNDRDVHTLISVDYETSNNSVAWEKAIHCSLDPELNNI